jgi:hypothetical protein
MTTNSLCNGHFSTIHSDLFLSLLPFKPKNILSYPYYIMVAFFMDLVIPLDPNGCKELLSHDDVIKELKIQGWDVFLKRCEGYNLQVAKAFAQTFDGCREKIGDTELDLTEGLLSEEIGLPSTGEKWFKNS